MASRPEIVRTYGLDWPDTEEGLVWTFQLSTSPFWGGFFERLIGVVKKALANWPLIRRYSQEELITILCEVEALVNSRPITVSNQSSSPLTPAHFLIGRAPIYRPPVSDPEATRTTDELLSYMELCRQRDELWDRLRHEYWTTLRDFHRTKRTREPVVGELVLVTSSLKKRSHWDWGKISTLIRGSDGVVRGVALQMPSGERWERPVQAIVPLEASSAPLPREGVTAPWRS